MLMLPPSVKIFLCAQDTDMRRSFDKLSQMAREQLKQDPFSGHLFVFFNKPCDRVKVLYWDRSGFCLFYKRLEEGRFKPPRMENCAAEIPAAELALILEGIEFSGANRRKTFSFY